MSNQMTIGYCLCFCGILVLLLGIAQVKYANENKLPNTLTNVRFGIRDEKTQERFLLREQTVPWGYSVEMASAYLSGTVWVEIDEVKK